MRTKYTNKIVAGIKATIRWLHRQAARPGNAIIHWIDERWCEECSARLQIYTGSKKWFGPRKGCEGWREAWQLDYGTRVRPVPLRTGQISADVSREHDEAGA